MLVIIAMADSLSFFIACKSLLDISVADMTFDTFEGIRLCRVVADMTFDTFEGIRLCRVLGSECFDVVLLSTNSLDVALPIELVGDVSPAFLKSNKTRVRTDTFG